MSVTIDLSPELEAKLREEYDDLDCTAREALLIEAYRNGRISVGRLGLELGIGTMAAYQWLDDHGVGPNYTADDFKSDMATLDELFGRTR